MILSDRPISRGATQNNHPTKRQAKLNSSSTYDQISRNNKAFFARHWSPLCLLLAPAMYFAYRYIADHVSILTGAILYYAYSVPVVYFPALILLGLAFFIQKKAFFQELFLIGRFTRKDLAIGLSAVTILYVAVFTAAHYIGNPREPSMVSLYQFKTDYQVAVLLISILILPPIVEELLYRHFILTALPVFKDRFTAILAILLTAMLFAWVHKYEYTLTYVSLFLVGIIFGVARVHSKGMLLPILLHSYAIGFVLLSDQVVKLVDVSY